MSFFKKMKERLFKSSSKLDAGLVAIVDEAAEEVAGQTAAPAAPGSGSATSSGASSTIASSPASSFDEDLNSRCFIFLKKDMGPRSICVALA